MTTKTISKRKISIFALALISLSNTNASAYFREAHQVNRRDFELALTGLFPQRISVDDNSYQNCEDLSSAQLTRDSLVIMAVENSARNQNAEFWVVKSDPRGNDHDKNKRVKKLVVTCHFKRPTSNKSAGSNINQFMLDAISPQFKVDSKNSEGMLKTYSAKNFNQQIADYAQKKSMKQMASNEPEALLNTILGAIGVEIFGGGAWATATGDGTWRQEKYYPYEIHSTSASYGAGISVKPSQKVEFRIGYQHLMSFGIDALANASDYNVEPCHTPGSKVECWPPSHWHSEGGVNQVYLTYGRKFFIYGFPIIAEAGVNAYQATYTITVPDYNGGGPEDGPPSEPHFLQVKTPVKTRISGSFGVGTQPLPNYLPGLTLMASAEFPVGATNVNYPTGYNGFAVTMNARYRFCFLDQGNCRK